MLQNAAAHFSLTSKCFRLTPEGGKRAVKRTVRNRAVICSTTSELSHIDLAN